MHPQPAGSGLSRAARCALLLAALGPSCLQVPWRLRVLPDPVVRDARTGYAHYFVEVESLHHRRARLGRDGPLLEPGARLRVARDLPPGQSRDRLELFDPAGRRIASLSLRVPATEGSLTAEAVIPLPGLGGHALRVTAGFDAPNHREPGHRRALDLVPVLAEGTSAFGVEVRSPLAGEVLGVTSDAADRPGGRPNEIVLRAADGRVFRYAHFAQGSVGLRPGERVRPGDLLGRIGLSGETTGPHLHVELVGPRRAGGPRDSRRGR